MPKYFFALVISLLLCATTAISQAKRAPLQEAIKLEIPREGGANGASVAWHPIEKKYYVAIAGNVSYCLALYDAKGKLLSSPDLETQFDVRGLWYNPRTKSIQMNGYDEFGWAEYKLDRTGTPTAVKNLFEGKNQPNEQSVGAFDPELKQVYFLNEDGDIDCYALKTGEYEKKIALYNADIESISSVFEDYNTSTVIYTGIKDKEIGLLNFESKEIELFSKKTGIHTQTRVLPKDAPVEGRLNFAYANGIYWLFDKDTRIWHGFR
jgi:hypothetical protein